MKNWNSLTPEQIKQRLEAIPKDAVVNPYPYRGETRAAAVLVPLLRANGEWRLLFIHRAANSHDPHSGQISFPGGSREQGDADYAATALRETYEEIGLPPEKVQVLGLLPPHCTVTGYCVVPVVGVIPWRFPLRFSEGEVVRTFTVPLWWLADPQNRYFKRYEIPPYGEVQSWFYQPYEGEVIWGATARMVLALLEALEAAH